ncbi:unnamed protein product, partial [Prorocentrum cordatum]
LSVSSKVSAGTPVLPATEPRRPRRLGTAGRGSATASRGRSAAAARLRAGASRALAPAPPPGQLTSRMAPPFPTERAAASGRALARGRPRLCRPAPAAAAALHGASLLAARALEAPANHSHEGGRRGPAEVARRNLRRQLVPASHPMRLAEQS